jgi:UrcA family protein
MLKTISAVAALAVASVFAVPTVSQAEDSQSVRVSYADLNLASVDGRHRLQHRVTYAAKTVCDLGETSSQLSLAALTKDCREDTIARAQPQLAAVIDANRRGTVTVGGAAALILTAQ